MELLQTHRKHTYGWQQFRISQDRQRRSGEQRVIGCFLDMHSRQNSTRWHFHSADSLVAATCSGREPTQATHDQARQAISCFANPKQALFKEPQGNRKMKREGLPPLGPPRTGQDIFQRGKRNLAEGFGFEKQNRTKQSRQGPVQEGRLLATYRKTCCLADRLGPYLYHSSSSVLQNCCVALIAGPGRILCVLRCLTAD